MKLLPVFSASVLALASLAGHAQEINFGIIATDSASVERDRWEPLFRDMEKKTGLTVKAFYAPDYAGVVEAMRFNKVQVAWYGNKAAIDAVDRSGGEVFAQVQKADGSLGYSSLLITQKDSPYNNLNDVLKNSKAINFGIGDPGSTSGFLVPSYYVFAMNKVDARSAFKTIRNASHGANIQAVLAKQIDVATNNTEETEKLEASKPEVLKELKIIWKSPLIPNDPIVWRKDLDAGVKAKVKGFLLAYGKSDADKAVMKNIYNYSGFKESTNEQLVPIRQLELFKDRRKVENDEQYSADEKAQRIAEIDKKLASLNK
jgi:phosphonate transport system substrate-binding protein